MLLPHVWTPRVYTLLSVVGTSCSSFSQSSFQSEPINHKNKESLFLLTASTHPQVHSCFDWLYRIISSSWYYFAAMACAERWVSYQAHGSL